LIIENELDKGGISQSCEAILQVSQRKLTEIHAVRWRYHMAMCSLQRDARGMWRAAM